MSNHTNIDLEKRKGIGILLTWCIEQYNNATYDTLKERWYIAKEFVAEMNRAQYYNEEQKRRLNELRSMYYKDKLKKRIDSLDDVTWGT